MPSGSSLYLFSYLFEECEVMFGIFVCSLCLPKSRVSRWPLEIVLLHQVSRQEVAPGEFFLTTMALVNRCVTLKTNQLEIHLFSLSELKPTEPCTE